jgi:hypothetical protein
LFANNKQSVIFEVLMQCSIDGNKRKMALTFPTHDPYFYSGKVAGGNDAESIAERPELYLPTWATEVLLDAGSNEWMTDNNIDFTEDELTIYQCLTIKKGNASGWVIASFKDNPPMHLMSEMAADMIRGLGAHYGHYTD